MKLELKWQSKLKFRWHFRLSQNNGSAIPAIDQYRCRYTSCSTDQKKKIQKKSKYKFKACSHTRSLQHSHKRDCHHNYSLDYCLERTVNKIKMCCDLDHAWWQSKSKAWLCCITLTCSVFWVSKNILEMCVLSNRCRIWVPGRLLDWWCASENNNLPPPSLTHCPFSLSFSFI